jgi:hypothetical protein
MKHMRTTTLLLLVGTASLATAQDFQGTLGGGIGMSIPTGDFDRYWGKNMFQLGAHLAFPLGKVPVVQGGFAFGYSVMGRNDRTVPITTDYLGVTDGTLTTRCRVFSYHPLLRLSPLQGSVRPYVDGMVGFRQFSTTSKVEADGVEENISKERNETDLAFSTGWAAGVMMTLGDVAYVEVRVERFDSGNATYVDPESVTVSDAGTVGFNTLTSNTDVTNVLVGIGLRF